MTEKELFLFLEKQGIKLDTYLKLKINEKVLEGEIGALDCSQYNDLIHLKKDAFKTNNPCLVSMTHTPTPIKVKDFMIKNEDGIISFQELMENKKLRQYEKDDVIFRGLENISQEYRELLEKLFKNYEDVLTDYKQLLHHSSTNEMKQVKRFMIPLFILYPVLIAFYYLYVKVANSYGFYTVIYTIITNSILFVVFFKGLVTSFLSNQTKNHINFYEYHERCEKILESHDQDIEQFEQSLTLKKGFNELISFDAFYETNIKLKQLDAFVKKQIISHEEKVLEIVLRLNTWFNRISVVLMGLLALFTLFI